MQSRIPMCRLGLMILLMAAPAASLADDPVPADEKPRRTVILDTSGFWRLHHTLKPPVVRFDDGVRPILAGKGRWLDSETEEPAPGWCEADFDDSTWLRGPARIAMRSPYVSRLCMRGKFAVTDPAKAGDLLLTLAYQGGAAVTVNGRKLAERDLPSGTDGLAADYPREAFVMPDDTLLKLWKIERPWDRRRKPLDAEVKRRADLRERGFQNLVVPRRLLRKGVNVLAIEIVRAPYHKVVDEKKGDKQVTRRFGSPYDLAMNTCEFTRVQLTAAGPQGVEPNVVRPAGLQVWNSDLLTSDYDMDLGDRAEPLRPIRMVGARGGKFSGKVMVGCDAPIEGLAVKPGPLTSGTGTIAAANVDVRYALPGDDYFGVWGYRYGLPDLKHSRYAREPALLGLLEESAPATVPVCQKKTHRYDLATPGQPEPVLGAVAGVWLTVNVPPEATPGTYTGRVQIGAKGHTPVSVPVKLDVADWRVPDTQDWRTWSDMIQSPDTLALEYGVQPWSDEHFRLIARSFDYLKDIGCRIVYVPLICRTNFGNSESMVRWVERGGGRYEHDFSVLERYVDTAVAHMGRPKIIVFMAWDVYLIQQEKIRHDSAHNQEANALAHLKKLGATMGTGPLVTVLDPRTKKTENVYLPKYEEPTSRGLWQPLFAALRERMRTRGLEEAMMLGMMSDAWPTRKESVFFKEVSGGLPWVSHSHMGVATGRLHDVSPVAYQVRVWNVRFANNDPPGGSHHGWANPAFIAEYVRHRQLHGYPVSRIRHQPEITLTGLQHGMARIGADFWAVIKDRRGLRQGTVAARFPESSWRNLDLTSSFLAPGADGPIATARLEIMREGVQECEARIAIEQALTDQASRRKLGAALAERCEDFLAERTRRILKAGTGLQLSGPLFVYVTQTTSGTYWIRRSPLAGHAWYAGTDWQARTLELFRLAGEVTRKVGTP